MNIEIKNISKSFGKKNVLNNLSFGADYGQCIGILGKNGSGKSTLFAIITGLIKGDGEFIYNGNNLMKQNSLRSKKVGFVPQSPPLIPELTAKDNLLLWYSKKELDIQLQNGPLKMLGIDEFIKMPVKKMSGGMKKRLAIGCCIAQNPEILLLDEPTSALDLVCKEKIYSYLDEYRKNGGIVIIATHDIYELQLCDTVYILKNGKLETAAENTDMKGYIECLKND